MKRSKLSENRRPEPPEFGVFRILNSHCRKCQKCEQVKIWTPKNLFHSPKVFWLKLVIFNTYDNCLDALNVGSEDAAGAVLVVVEGVGRCLNLNRRSEALQVGQRLPGLRFKHELALS